MNSIKHKIKIEDYLREKYNLELEGKGSYLKGKCILPRGDNHEFADHELSFTVSPIKQIFYCFGCHRGGDLIAFVAQKESKNQYEAYLILEKQSWKSLVNQLKIKMANGERDDEMLQELIDTQKLLLENHCI